MLTTMLTQTTIIFFFVCSTYLQAVSFAGGTSVLLMQCHCSWQDGLEIHTLASKLSSLGLNPEPAINCPGVSRQGDSSINVCAVPRMDIKLMSHL